MSRTVTLAALALCALTGGLLLVAGGAALVHTPTVTGMTNEVDRKLAEMMLDAAGDSFAYWLIGSGAAVVLFASVGAFAAARAPPAASTARETATESP